MTVRANRSLAGRLDRLKDPAFSYLLLTPALLLFVALGLFPLAYSLGLSFWEYKLNVPEGRRFVGLDHYTHMFADQVFLDSLLKTAYYTFATVSLSVGVGLAVALILNRKFVGKSFFLLAMIVPWAIPKVVNGLMWKWIYDGNYGIFNWLLLKLGIISEYRYWFNESAFAAMTLVIIADVWKNVPFTAVLLLAALKAVPKELYEAAKCDGAGRFGQFAHVTLPGIRNTLMIVLMTETMWAFKAFDLIYSLTRGGPGNNTTITYFYVYQQSFDYLNLGYGAAMAYFVTFIIVLFALLYYKALGRDADD